MFNLKSSPSEPRKEYNQDELQGYEEVPAGEWMNIEPRSYIRYEKSNGQLVRGGFVISKSIEKKVIYLQGDLSPTSLKWTVTTDSITRLWKKQTVNQDPDLTRSIKDLADRVSTLEINGRVGDDVPMLNAEIARLKARIRDIEDDLRKLLVVVTQLANQV